MKQHTKTLGQVFLHDQNIIEKIIKFAEPKQSETIVEIGCGKGILSKSLAQKCKNLHIVEIDTRWLDYVKAFAIENVTYHHSDVLKFDFSSLGTFKVIANIPYQITTPILEHLIKYKSQLSTVTIMIQKEVADRIMATPGTKTFGLLTLFCNYHFNIKKGFNVSKECFFPKPTVTSTVIQLTPKDSELATNDEQLFFAMTKSLFWGRRKTMLNGLLNSPHIHCNETIKDLKLPILKQRAEILSLSEQIKLFKLIKNELKLPL